MNQEKEFSFVSLLKTQREVIDILEDIVKTMDEYVETLSEFTVDVDSEITEGE
jgi:hypothetical protein